jgi:hypothetical protein
MSGGHFDCDPYHIGQSARQLARYLRKCRSNQTDEFGWKPSHPPEVMSKLEECLETLLKAATQLHAVDYLICGDLGTKSFLKAFDTINDSFFRDQCNPPDGEENFYSDN